VLFNGDFIGQMIEKMGNKKEFEELMA